MGNGGAAVAAYAAAAGMSAHMFAPADTQPVKLAQIRAFGAAVELAAGSRDAAERAAMQHALDGEF